MRIWRQSIETCSLGRIEFAVNQPSEKKADASRCVEMALSHMVSDAIYDAAKKKKRISVTTGLYLAETNLYWDAVFACITC